MTRPRRQSRKADNKTQRAELIERIRREIAAGTYDSPEKWEAALDRLLFRIENQ
jgi:hypothetical protein